MKQRFVFDPNRCVGCHACVVACSTTQASKGQPGANSGINTDTVLGAKPDTRHWRSIQTFNPARHPLLRVQHLSLACNHCEEPACLRHCPARAYTKDKATGAILHHANRCLGCRYCTWACPFDAPKYSEKMGVVEKCDFCVDLLKERLEPACVSHCPLNALSVEEALPSPEISHKPGLDQELPPAFPSTKLRPSIRFVGLRREAPPDMKVEGGRLARFLDPLLRMPHSKITLRGEWPLVVFTQIFALLWAGMLSSMMGGPRLHWALFLGLGVLAFGMSGWHLGKRDRAWRAVLNVFSSWLSREIFLVSLFLGFGVVSLYTGNRTYGWTAGGIGFAALIAIDRIYYLARPDSRGNLHSAQVVLGAAFLLGMLAKLPVLAISAGAIKLLLYLHRKLMRNDGVAKWLISLVRIFLGFIAPVVFRTRPLLALGLVLAGEVLDRLEFYLELEFDSPDRELAVKMWRIFKPMGGETPWDMLLRRLQYRVEEHPIPEIPQTPLQEKSSEGAG